MITRIRITELLLRTFIGFKTHEQSQRQDVVIDLEVDIAVDEQLLIADDAHQLMFDYREATKRIIRVVEGRRFQLLEALAHHILLEIMQSEMVQWACVCASKPNALRFAKSVSVSQETKRESHEAIIVLRSNINAEYNMQLVLHALHTGAGSEVILCQDQWLHTAPVSATAEPEYLNGAILLHTHLDHSLFKSYLRGIEDVLKRDSTRPKDEPRTMDIHIVFWDGVVVNEKYYHPGYAFVRSCVEKVSHCSVLVPAHPKKYVLITGASSKIGRELSDHFLNKGYLVVHHYWTTPPKNKNEMRIDIRADLSLDSGVAQLCDFLNEITQKPALIVHCANIRKEETHSTERICALNVDAARKITERLCTLEHESSVIYMGDARVFRGKQREGEIAYTLHKQQIHALMRAHARSLAPNVFVNELVLGHIHGKDKISERHMLKRKTLLKDVISAVDFIFASRSITGQSLCVDDT